MGMLDNDEKSAVPLGVSTGPREDYRPDHEPYRRKGGLDFLDVPSLMEIALHGESGGTVFHMDGRTDTAVPVEPVVPNGIRKEKELKNQAKASDVITAPVVSSNENVLPLAARIAELLRQHVTPSGLSGAEIASILDVEPKAVWATIGGMSRANMIIRSTSGKGWIAANIHEHEDGTVPHPVEKSAGHSASGNERIEAVSRVAKPEPEIPEQEPVVTEHLAHAETVDTVHGQEANPAPAVPSIAFGDAILRMLEPFSRGVSIRIRITPIQKKEM